MNPPGRILVTGADGFVGRHLLPVLRRRFRAAVLIAGVLKPDRPNADADITLPLNLLSTESIADCVTKAKADAIVHLAAQSNVPQSNEDPGGTWQINVNGTLTLARMLMRRAPETRLVFVSSVDTYGLSFHSGEPLDEDAPFAPANPYAASKAAADLALGEMAEQGLKVVRMRPANHIGPGQSAEFVVPTFAKQIAQIAAGIKQERVVEVGSLDGWRDFLDVRDVCAAYAAALDRDLPPGIALNIASGEPRQIRNVLNTMLTLSGLDADIRTDKKKLRPNPIDRADINPARAKASLGWKREVDWEDTLASVLADWRERVRT